MHNFVVVVFKSEARADDGVRALDELHREGSVTVYETAVLRRDPYGELSVKREGHRIPLGRGVGPLLDELSDAVQRTLPPGGSALVGEVSEESSQPIDARMQALGGDVTRTSPNQLVANLVREDTAAMRADAEEISGEVAGTTAELMREKLELDVEGAKEALQGTAAKLHERVDRVREEIDAKLEVLHEQAAGASPEVRERIQRHIAELRRDLDEREALLRRAHELADAALH